MTRPARFTRLFSAVAFVALLSGACAGDRPTLEDPGASREVAEAAPVTSVPAGEALTLRLAVGEDWTPDPAGAGPASIADRVVAGLLFEGLTRLDRSGNVQPALAERWFVSDDRLQWTFVLPEDLVTADGGSLTARDVKSSLERLAERGAADQIVAELSPIAGWGAFVAGESGGAAGISAVDERTLVITLDAPFEPLVEVLAGPAYGVVVLTDDGGFRTTGAYTFGDTPDELVAVGSTAAVGRIELVATETPGDELIDAGTVDWAVLPSGGVAAAPATTLRQPLDLRVGLVVRLADPAQRQALLAVINPVDLAATLDHMVVAVAPTIESRPAALPSSVDVIVPAGPLAAIGPSLQAQLVSAGVDATVTELDHDEFADAVAGGHGAVFPMVQTGLGFARSVSVATATPGVDDLFGATGQERAEIVDEIVSATDPADRSALVDALEQQLAAEFLWLPVANAEARVGLSERMAALRVLPDGTFDLSEFGAE